MRRSTKAARARRRRRGSRGRTGAAEQRRDSRRRADRAHEAGVAQGRLEDQTRATTGLRPPRPKTRGLARGVQRLRSDGRGAASVGAERRFRGNLARRVPGAAGTKTEAEADAQGPHRTERRVGHRRRLRLQRLRDDPGLYYFSEARLPAREVRL